MHQAAPNIEEIFFAALELDDPDARSSFLDRACGDPEVRRRVERLLARDAQAGGFLESPAAPPTVSVEPPSRSESPGTVIGLYKLMEQIGEGGMGVVYVAEQTKPVRRKVALKIIKPGMDTKQVIARFEAERQALAMMDHPNIAKVHDGGTTPSGRPYFVMELVRGIPITEYCDRERLSIPERLELFVLVCRAVQHAHQKGIIHRDLKPSNILVTLIDGAAVPKVIDFGVAKATGASLTDRTLYTAFQQFIGTPLYMSPEQADLSGMDVDTRSDIYSLGVLLYELLTGATPFDEDTFRTAAFDELRRIIREQEPPKPSTRLSSLGATRANVSANRKADARQLHRAVRGELDWIVMKALEKDRRRRYETANDFAADVMRFLTDQPVEACPASAWYRLRKFASRNRRRLATAAVLVVSGLIIGGVLLAVQLQKVGRVRELSQDVRQALAGARTAIEARDSTLAGQRVAEAQGRLGAEAASLPALAAAIDTIRSEIDARQAEAARFSEFLKATGDAQDRVSDGVLGGQHDAEKALGLYAIMTEKDWLSRLESSYLTADQKQQVRETAYATLLTLADFYVRWRRTEPRSIARSLDLLQRAQDFHQPTRAFYFVRAQCRRAQGNSAAAVEDDKQFKAAHARTAWDYYLPGHSAAWAGDLDEAIRSYQAALRLQPNHYNSLYYLAIRLGTDKVNRWPEAIAYFTACIALRPDSFGACISRGNCLMHLGDLDGAKADFEAAQALAKNDLNREEAMGLLGGVHLARQEYSKAEPLLLRGLEAERRGKGEEHSDTLRSMNTLAFLYAQQGKLDKAEPLHLQALEVSRRVQGEEHPDTLAFMDNLGWLYWKQGQYAKAEPLRVRVLEVNRRVLGQEHSETLMNMNNLAMVYAGEGKFAEAQALQVRALEIARRVLGQGHGSTLNLMYNLGVIYRDAGRMPQAIELFEQVRAEALKQPGFPADDPLGVSAALAWIYEEAGQFAKAEPVYREALERLRHRHEEASSDWANLRVFHAYSLVKQQRYAEAETLLRECLKFREHYEPDDWTTFNTKSVLGGSLLGQKKYVEAEPLLAAGYEGMKQREGKIPPSYTYYLTAAVERLVLLYDAWGQPAKAAAWRDKLPRAAPVLPADVFAGP
jgi:serine/threonine-protein kinase